MRVYVPLRICSLLFVPVCSLASCLVVRAEEPSRLLVDAGSAWSAVDLDPGLVPLGDLPVVEDYQVEMAQMLAPQRRPGVQLSQQQRSSQESTRDSGLASVPFMIGDTGSGSCLSFGSFLEVDLAHPTMACSRLNISEANTAIPTDRLYYSYRHFHNATPTRVFQYREDFDVDRHMLAGERTFFDKMMSMEIRLPLDYRLSSQVGSYAINPFDQTVALPPGFDPLFGFGSDRKVELGNISMIFKSLLTECNNFALSAGLGVTLPTARDVTYDARIDEYVTFTNPDLLARYAIEISALAANETIYLSPFAAWVWQPTERFFHQGFLQVEAAANSSFFLVGGGGLASYDIDGDGYVSNNFPDPDDVQYGFITPFPQGFTRLQPQTLMRLNLGWGYVLAENPRADFIQKLTGLFEIHYTTTLNDAAINSVPLTVISGTGYTGYDSITVGNRANRVDIINLVTGLTANMGKWVVTNGCAVPVKECPCSRGFDFEYNLQVQRIF
jgi:hypothetical protein